MERVKKIILKNNVKSFGFLDFSLVDISFNVKNSQKLNENFKSVIMLSFPYYSKNITNGNISAYASVNDYHTVIRKKIAPVIKNLEKSFYGHKFLNFTDSSPINEVVSAQKCGLGAKGINSLLITKKYGSYVFLSSIITTLKLETTKIATKTCISCDLCIRSCPTSAISKEFGVDKSKCLSDITQRKGELTLEEKNAMKKIGTMWGCDICQKVCPHNKNVQETYVKEFYNDTITNLDRKTIEETYKNRSYGWRGKNILLRNLDIIEEND